VVLGHSDLTALTLDDWRRRSTAIPTGCDIAAAAARPAPAPDSAGTATSIAPDQARSGACALRLSNPPVSGERSPTSRLASIFGSSLCKQESMSESSTRHGQKRSRVVEFLLDKFIDFILIFVGLYAAASLARYQDEADAKDEYVLLLKDFKRELAANLQQETSIEKDLGPLTETTPGKNLGPIEKVFHDYFEELQKDEKVAHCLHVEFASTVDSHVVTEGIDGCHEAYKKFDESHGSDSKHFDFEPAVLTPFYRYEVWELYQVSGVSNFRNKELAVQIGEIYNNARLVERMVADIETTYNDSFLSQVGRSAATDMALAEIVHDEETTHGLSAQDQKILIQVAHDVKHEYFAALEAQNIIALKVERLKNRALLLRKEITEVSQALDQEIGIY
jgi:hypothetical protein